jgi:hypothetical protein
MKTVFNEASLGLLFSLAISLTFMTQGAVAGDDVPKDLPSVWNGNTCEPDSMRVCLGVQGQGRATWVKCMREHYAQLTAECQKVMNPKNFKSQAESDSPDARAASGAASY